MKHIDKFELEPGILVKIYPEFDPDWSWIEVGSKDERLVRDGHLEQVIVEVTVFDSSGEVSGTDSLGGVCIGLDAHKQEIRDTIDSNSMVQEARADLKNKLARILAANRAV
jgi:hypothetical protein